MNQLSELHATLLEERRGIPADLAARLGIVSRGNLIGFEYRRHGKLLFTKWRAPQKRFWIEPSPEKLSLWNLDCCQDLASTGGTLIICEGEADAASFGLTQYPCYVSVPNGAPSREGVGDIVPSEDKQYAYLWENGQLLPELKAAKKIILATDNDKPGRVLAAELATRLGADRCYLMGYPEDCKDANEILVKHGPAVLEQCADSATALVPDKLVTWSELPKDEPKPGLGSGWVELDPHLLLTFPELVVVTGKPGSGKSRFTLSWVNQLCRIHNLSAAYITLEDTANRLRRHSYQYAKQWAGREMTNPATGEVCTPIPYGGEEAWLNRHLRFVAPSIAEEDTRDLEWLKRIIWEAACRHDCKIVALDPWNELEHMWDRKGMGIDEYITAALRDLKRIARRYSIALVVVAHPDKSAGRNESVEEMTLYSISGGAAWKNKADGGLIVAQEVNEAGSTGFSLIKVDKRKDWDVMGEPGTARLFFDVKTGLYSSANGR